MQVYASGVTSRVLARGFASLPVVRVLQDAGTTWWLSVNVYQRPSIHGFRGLRHAPSLTSHSQPAIVGSNLAPRALLRSLRHGMQVTTASGRSLGDATDRAGLKPRSVPVL